MLLVTGGSGHIGSHTRIEFAGAGYDVAVLGANSNGYETVKQGETSCIRH